MTRKISILTVLIALLVLVVGLSMAQPFRDLAEAPREEANTTPGNGADDDTLTLLLVGDGSSFDLTPSPGGGGAFYVGGTLYDVDTGEALGDFQCWGWFFTAERRMVTQEWNIGDAGTIITVGEELVNPLAITGGTGDFRGADGQMVFEFTDGEGILVHFSFGDGDDDEGDDG